MAVATVSAVIDYFTQIPYINSVSIAGVVGYIVFGLLSKPNYKRMAIRRTLIVPFIISRLVLAILITAVIAYTFSQ